MLNLQRSSRVRSTRVRPTFARDIHTEECLFQLLPSRVLVIPVVFSVHRAEIKHRIHYHHTVKTNTRIHKKRQVKSCVVHNQLVSERNNLLHSIYVISEWRTFRDLLGCYAMNPHSIRPRRMKHRPKQGIKKHLAVFVHN